MFQRSMARRLPQSDALTNLLMGGTDGAASMALGATLNIFDIVAQSLLVIFTSLYWSADNLRIERLFLSFMDPSRH